MATFLGYCVQCLGVGKGEHTFLLYFGYVANVSPQEQWDNTPVIGQQQILTFVGMLESYGEIPGDVPHYTATGGLPGYYLPSMTTARRSSSASTSRSFDQEFQAYHLGRHRVPLLVRCRQLLTWFVTARQPAGVLVCAWT